LQEAESAILTGLAETLEKNLSVEALLDELLRRCLEETGLSGGLAYMLDQDARFCLRAKRGSSDLEASVLESVPGRLALLGQAIESREPLLISRFAAAGPIRDWLDLARAETVLFAPLLMGAQRIGALVLVSSARELDEGWRVFARTLGRHIGPIIRLAAAFCSLRQNEEHLSRIVQTLAEGVLIADRDGRFTLANAAAERILGLPAGEITKRTHNDPCFRARSPDGELLQSAQHPCDRAVATGEPVRNVEMWIDQPDGRRVFVSANASPLRDAAGEITGVVLSLNDITDYKRQQESLARSNAELKQFAYVVAHDLKEPLRTVASFTQLLAERYKGALDEKADQFISRAVSGTQRMARLIDDLLAYARAGSQAPDPQPVAAEAVFQSALANLEAAIQSSGATVAHTPLPVVSADPSELNQLFQNLIGNALKFHSDAPPSVEVSAERKGGEWIFSIRDNGIGIDPKHADRIFQVFERVHSHKQYSGSGIGLATCKKIVERHGGRIWVESEPGKGSTFRFVLPAEAAAGVEPAG
jgi:PAS domain S-box-containing protein